MRRAPGTRYRAALAAVAAGLAIVIAAPPAAADVASDGLWYFDVLNVQDAHDAGFTGEGVTIAVIDTPINPDIATLRGTDLRVQESPECYIDGALAPVATDDVALAVHGTNVVSMIIGTGAGDNGQVGVKGVAPGATVLHYREDLDRVCTDANGGEVSVMAEAIDAAVTAGADIISLSIAFSADQAIYEAIVRALHEGVILVNGVANREPGEGADPWSTSINGAVTAQAIGRDGEIATHDEGGVQVPNLDPLVDVAAPGVGILVQGHSTRGWADQRLETGTSLATPIVAGFLAVTSQKYPDATSNQLIQSLIHNTGVEDHDLERDDEIGYGVVSLTHLLREDPTQYPDVNPLLVDGGDPLPRDVLAGPDGAPLEDPLAEPEPRGDAWGVVLALVLGTVGVLVVAAVIVTVVLLARRRGRAA